MPAMHSVRFALLALTRTTRALSLLAALVLAASLTACQPAGSEAPEPTLVIEGGRVIIGDGPVLEEASVVISGDSIAAVTEEAVEAPNARRIDAAGKTVLPGLVDAHVHLTIPPGGRDSAAVAEHMEENVPGILRGFLENGVTTVRSTGEYWPSGGELRDRIASGELEGPRMITSGPIFTTEGGHPVPTACADSPFCRSHATREVTGPEEARAAVRRLAEEGVDFIKLASDTVLAPVQPKDEVVQAIIGQSHQAGLKAVGHVPETELMERYAEMGMDGFVHPPMRPLGRTRQLAGVLNGRAAPVTTTLYAVLAYTDEPIETSLDGSSSPPEVIEFQAQHLAVLAEAGVSVAVGTDWCPCNPGNDSDFAPGAMTVTEMKSLRWGGMSEEAIIEAATANAARALEMADEVGTLEAGKLVDLIVVEGNPLDDLSALDRVETVVQDGDVVASD